MNIKPEYKIWDGKFTKEIKKQYKISLCTTCMNRTKDLMETLPFNIVCNRKYTNLEIVILDYNSKDGLEDYIKKGMKDHIDSGLINYYRTTEPKHYSMTHSRNIAFKLASGDIVNNIDADNYTLEDISFKNEPELCFAEYINKLANQAEEKAIFAKGKRLMRGRLGFFKNEFINDLGGYDEQLKGYGHDDHDLMLRAWELGYTLYWFGGQYLNRIKTSTEKKNENMEIKDWRITETTNKQISENNINNKIFKANQNFHWGKAKLIKNFKEEIEI